MTKVNQKNTGMHRFFREATRLSVPLFTLTLLAACSSEPVSDLAVDKLSTSQAQATSFLPLNADKPGTPVDVQRYLVPGKYTIVDYFSPYDNTSTSLEPRLAQLTEVRRDIAVRTVNVNRPDVQGIDWQSPIMENVRIQALPYFQIYDPTQALRAQGRPAHEQIKQWVQDLPEEGHFGTSRY